MKKTVLIIFILFFPAGEVMADSVSVCLEGLSVHPENQRDFSGHYDRKLDSDGDFVITPGIHIFYDRAVSGDWFNRVRFMGSYMSDCAELPAGYIGAGVVCPVENNRNYSVDFFLGGGWFGRRDWSSRFKNYYSPVLHRSGRVEWMIAPFPGLDLCLHPWRGPVSFVISFSTIIYVSQLSAGVQVKM